MASQSPRTSRKLKELTTERDSAQQRLRKIEKDRDRMRMQLDRMERGMMEGAHGLSPMLFHELLQHPELRHLIMDDAPLEIFRRRSRQVLVKLPTEILSQMQEEGFVNTRKELTSAGAFMMRAMARREFS